MHFRNTNLNSAIFHQTINYKLHNMNQNFGLKQGRADILHTVVCVAKFRHNWEMQLQWMKSTNNLI